MTKSNYFVLSIIALITISYFPLPAAAQKNVSNHDQSDPGIKTGGSKMIPVTTPHGTFNVWTKRIGNNPKIKVLLVSGGPGVTHEYLEAFESFFPKEGIEFIYYDQLGVGYSDNPKDTTLFKLSRVVDELEQVRKALDLDKENLYLYGQSWGGIVAMEYALKYPHNLKALLISNMVSSAKAYNSYNAILEEQIPAPILDSIRILEDKHDFDNPQYSGLLLQNYFPEHILRLPVDKWPEPVLRAIAKPNFDYARIILGLNQFIFGGELTNWNIESKLSEIMVPTLVIGAKYDYMNPEHMKWMSTKVHNGSYLYCPNGSHFCLYDDQNIYMSGIIKYINAVSNGAVKVVL